MKKSNPRRKIDPMGCITRRMPLADDQTRDLGIAYRVSLQAMLKGHGNEQAFSTLACALNIGLVRVRYRCGCYADYQVGSGCADTRP